MSAAYLILLSCLGCASIGGDKIATEETRGNKTEVTTIQVYINGSSSQKEIQKVDSEGEIYFLKENTTIEQNSTSREQSPEEDEIENHGKHDIDNIYLTEDPEYGTVSANDIHDPKKFERREDNGYVADQDMQESSQRMTSPKVDPEMAKRAFQEDKENKIRYILSDQHKTKAVQRRTFDIMGMLGLKSEENNMDIIKIIKEVSVPVPYPEEQKIPVPVKVEVERPIPVEVPKHYPVRVEKKVYYPVKEYISAPYPVFKKVPYLVKVSIENPVPIKIAKPYPVFIERKVPYPVEKQIPFPVKIPVDRPVPVHIPVLKNIYYPVEKKINYPVPVHVEKPVPVPVEKPYPVYVEKKEPDLAEENIPYHSQEQQIEDHFESSPLDKENTFQLTENKQSEYGSLSYDTNLNKEHDFVLTEDHHSIADRNHNKLQNKKDEEDLTVQETKTEINTKIEKTTKVLATPNTQATIKEDAKSKPKKKEAVEEFGKRIKKL